MTAASGTLKEISLQVAAGIFYDLTLTASRGWEEEGALSLQKIYLVCSDTEQDRKSTAGGQVVSKEDRDAFFRYLKASNWTTVCCFDKRPSQALDWLQVVEPDFFALNSGFEHEVEGFHGLVEWLNGNREQNPLVIAPADWLRTLIVAALDVGAQAAQRFALDGGRITILQYTNGRFFLETLNMNPGGTGRE